MNIEEDNYTLSDIPWPDYDKDLRDHGLLHEHQEEVSSIVNEGYRAKRMGLSEESY